MSQTAAVRKLEVAGPVTDSEAWRQALALPCRLTVELPLPDFTVGNLAQLAKDEVIDSHWSISEDVPVRVNGVLIAWSEFEVVGNRLGVRLTELD